MGLHSPQEISGGQSRRTLLTKYSKGTSDKEIQDIVQNFRRIRGEYLWRYLCSPHEKHLFPRLKLYIQVEHVKLLVFPESCLVFHPEDQAVKVKVSFQIIFTLV